MVRPEIKKAEKSKRKTRIVDFFNHNPFSSKDILYRNGIVPKSKASHELIDELVRERKINEIHSENGKIRYYVPRHWSVKLEWNKEFPLLSWHCKDIQYLLRKFEDEKRETSDILSRFRRLVKLRSSIYSTEINRKLDPSILLLDRDVTYLNDFLLQNNYTLQLPLWNKNSKLISSFKNPIREEILRFIDTNIIFAEILLKHQIHKTGFCINLYKKYKFTNYRRTVEERLKMKYSGDHQEWGLKKQNFDKSVNMINTENITNYKKILDNLGAETQTATYKNNEYAVYAYMLALIERDLVHLRELFQKSGREFENERITLSLWWDLIQTIAVKRMENKLLGNKNSLIHGNIKASIPRGLEYNFVNDFDNMDGDELEMKKFFMFLALAGEI